MGYGVIVFDLLYMRHLISHNFSFFLYTILSTRLAVLCCHMGLDSTKHFLVNINGNHWIIQMPGHIYRT